MLLTNTLIFLSCSLCAGVYQYYKYIHNWSLQPFSQDCGLASHATYVVCFNFIHEWQDLQFNVDSEQQIFEKLFMAILFTFPEFLPEICWKEIAEKNTFRISFWCLAWSSNPVFLSNKPTHYLLDHGDFILISAFYYIHKVVLFRDHTL